MDLTGEVGQGGWDIEWYCLQTADLLQSSWSQTLPARNLGTWIPNSIFSTGTAPNSCMLSPGSSLVPWFRVDLKGILVSGYCRGPHRQGIVFLVSLFLFTCFIGWELDTEDNLWELVLHYVGIKLGVQDGQQAPLFSEPYC